MTESKDAIMEKIRIGFIGVGGMGQCAHLRNYATLRECEIVALAELRPQLGKVVATRYGVPNVYTDWQEMVQQTPMDALVCVQPFTIHGQLIPDIIAAGLPILTEKPLASTLSAGDAIINALERDPKSRLYLGYMKRSDPASLFARQQIEEWKENKDVGNLRYLRLTMPPGKWDMEGFSTLLTTDEPYPALAYDPAPADRDTNWQKNYVEFVNYYIHQVNLARFLLGEGYTVETADRGGRLLIGTSISGATVTLEMAPYQMSLDWQEQALIAFDRGWIRLDLPAPMVLDQAGHVTVYQDSINGKAPITFSPTLPPVHAMRQQARHFLQAVRGESTPLSDAEEGLEDLRIARDYMDLLTALRRG